MTIIVGGDDHTTLIGYQAIAASKLRFVSFQVQCSPILVYSTAQPYPQPVDHGLTGYAQKISFKSLGHTVSYEMFFKVGQVREISRVPEQMPYCPENCGYLVEYGPRSVKSPVSAAKIPWETIYKCEYVRRDWKAGGIDRANCPPYASTVELCQAHLGIPPR
ncbi:hypothetical protein L873DRAFT_1839651 [Choiromyces venosus 120613-1]|uniref:Uncharacterized protein n=1 Tax=Choiromyces venosus 120613-1 TaxID=1336337 RepID=A0A3N4KA85_9PEZI|nr:hypothetical protein L873DRAFT_1839651 [Choiromyces venosus 120613-1]